VNRLRSLRSLPLGVAMVISAVAGLIGATAFAPFSLWPAAFISLFLLWWSLDQRNFWTGALLGVVYGFSFWAPLINWLTVYLGPVPWAALAITEALYISLACGLIALVVTYSAKLLGGSTLVYTLVPVAIAGLWVAHEWLAASWPWGGFSWARFGMAQYDSPIVHALSWIGAAGLSFVIAWSTAATYVLFSRVKAAKRTLIIPALMLVACAAVPLFPTNYQGTISIAGVQGNTKSGLFDQVRPGDNLAAHVETTLAKVTNPVSLIVWPENATDIDPTRDSVAAGSLAYLSNRFAASILTGTITSGDGNVFYNSSLLWRDKHLIAQYDKAHPVPFAEWMPARDVFHALVPDLVDMVTRDYTFGNRPNVIAVDNHQVGVSICFDIVDDQLTREMLSRGAQVIVAQTNNADFGKTAESAQQLEIAQARAIETGRYVMNVSTVGITALIGPDGNLIQRSPQFVAGVVQSSHIPLARTTPPASFANLGIDISATAFGLAFALAVIVRRTRRCLGARANMPIVRRE